MTLSSVATSPKLVKYELLGEIGHGGMATVYRARDLRLDREVAVKVIHPHLRDNAEVAARFVTEARSVAKLRHPGIVEIFDVSDEADNERYLVAELVRGPSLRTLLCEQPEIPAEIAACIGVLLCDALSHAHAAGVVHRDVKPENVLLQSDASSSKASVKLTDFGIAKILDAKGVTSTGQVLGSPAHMAPEQVDGGRVDERTDVFGLGVLIYEVMTASLPFDGANPAQVLRRVLEGDFTPADQVRPTVGACWARLVAKAIAKQPEERFSSAHEFGEALRAELLRSKIDEPQEELFRFIAEPKAYLDAFVPSVIELLIARATRARSSGQLHLVASDLNRAIAYAPDNTELLGLVAGLARGRERRVLLRRLAAIGVLLSAACAIGLVCRPILRARSVASAVVSSGGAPLFANSSALSAVVPAVPVAHPVSSSSGGDAGSSVPRVRSAALPVRRLERAVVIKANPQSALVAIDGRGPVAVGFEQRVVLPVGSHTFLFSVPPENECCDSRTIVQEIRADDGSDSPQLVQATLPFRPATLVLVGGPADARMTCEMINVRDLPSGTPARVEMSKVDRIVHCLLKGGELSTRQSSVQTTLYAGAVSQVRWPPPL